MEREYLKWGQQDEGLAQRKLCIPLNKEGKQDAGEKIGSKKKVSGLEQKKMSVLCKFAGTGKGMMEFSAM